MTTRRFPPPWSERNAGRRVIALGRRNHLPLLVLRRSSSAIVRQPRSFLFSRKLPAFTALHNRTDKETNETLLHCPSALMWGIA
jgi:hypothetical protein